MSIVIVLLVVIIVGTLIAKFYPTPKSDSIATQEVAITPDVEELIQEAARVTIPETVTKAPQPKKRGPKSKPQGAPKTMAAKKVKKKTN